ncbi:MAG: YceI family protein [Bacteriovoracaceae bacterium]|jgi:polyisoprenoid-binding protein YceI|nr:YceI family protein [Bacteriovoracaceae bacterium]
MIKILLTVILFCTSLGAFARGSISIKFELKPAGTFNINIEDVQGFLATDGKVVQTSKIVADLTTLTTGVELRDQHTKRYLNVKKFPVATFLKGRGKKGRIKGVLIVKGIEREIMATYEIRGDRAVAKFKTLISDYGLEYIKYKEIFVKDEMWITITLPIKYVRKKKNY